MSVNSMAMKLGRLMMGCLCLWLLSSAAPAAAEPAEGQAEITADTIDYDETRGEVRLLGNVKICYDGVTITSSYANYLTKKQLADLQGHVAVSYEGTTAQAAQMIARLSEHKVQLRGQAGLTDRRKDADQRVHTTNLSAEEITYDWQEQIASAKGNVAVEREGRRAYAETAEYNILQHSVVMKGNVRFEQGRNEWLMSESVVMDLTARKIEAKGRVSGRFVIGAGSTKQVKKKEETEDLPELAPIEPALQTQTVEDVRAVLLPALKDE